MENIYVLLKYYWNNNSNLIYPFLYSIGFKISYVLLLKVVMFFHLFVADWRLVFCILFFTLNFFSSFFAWVFFKEFKVNFRSFSGDTFELIKNLVYVYYYCFFYYNGAYIILYFFNSILRIIVFFFKYF